MGWCSGTDAFDVAVMVVLNEGWSLKAKIKFLIEEWQSLDWDCEMDSLYWEHPVVREVFMELYPDWFNNARENNADDNIVHDTEAI